MQLRHVPTIVPVCNIKTETPQSFATLLANVKMGTPGLHLVCSLVSSTGATVDASHSEGDYDFLSTALDSCFVVQRTQETTYHRCCLLEPEVSCLGQRTENNRQRLFVGTM